MSEQSRKAAVVIPIVVLMGAGLAWGGSTHSPQVAGLPLFCWAVAAAFVIQWLVYVPSLVLRTERFFDLTGSLTFIIVTVLAAVLSTDLDPRAGLLAAMVVIWAARLGSFLFMRIRRAGADDRFDEIKTNPLRFLLTWTLQGLWVAMTSAAAWIAITSVNRVGLDAFAIIGLAIWLFGFGFEVVADLQKSAFKADPANAGKFISTGLWAKSRHPNYFGEIVIWTGALVVAIPVLRGWDWIALASPVFVALLLTKLSGIPMLEAKADSKWGGQPDYEQYKARTPILVPRP
ncbi:MAG: DUF1295 domain-containing protein [Propionibacterium sp.]|jgi:steroid 5-alpha reductase family enzyme|nr:DUF1295 domain-containing protein [Propionibacterium sp.]